MNLYVLKGETNINNDLKGEINMIKNCFNILDTFEIKKFPCEIDNGLLLIFTHGVYRGKYDNEDYIININEQLLNTIPKNYCLKFNSNDEFNDTLWLDTKYLSKLINIKNSIIIFDACYSSDLNINTLSGWKSNLIFTCGYVKEYSSIIGSDLAKAINKFYEQNI